MALRLPLYSYGRRLDMKQIEDRVRGWIAFWDASDQHRTGSLGDMQTSEWLLHEACKLGAEAELHNFPFERIDIQDAHLRVGQMSYEGVPMFDGGSTPAQGITGRLSPVPIADSLLVLSDSVSGNILNKSRTGSEVKGVVVVSNSHLPGIALINADSFETPFGSPVLQVPSESREELRAVADSSEPATLAITFHRKPTHAANVKLMIPGTKTGLDPLVIMTPKSSWYTSTAERVGGIVCWLECIRHFVENPPTRNVIFTANTGHELGHVGLSRFLDADPSLVKRAFLWVHLGANFGANESDIRLQSSSSSQLHKLRTSLERHNVTVAGEVRPGTRPGGEARDIFDGGGNYISILGSNQLFHHPDDRFSTNLDLPRLIRIRSSLIECVQDWAFSV